MSEFSIWFKGKFLEWQAEQMGVKSISDFATFLGVSQPNASRWLNGQSKPRDHENIRRLVGFYGNEVYEVLGIENPITDDRLRLINEHWDGLPENGVVVGCRLHSSREQVVVAAHSLFPGGAVAVLHR